MSRVTNIAHEQQGAVAELNQLEQLAERAAERVFDKFNSRGIVPVQPRYLRTEAAAKFLTLDAATLQTFRTSGRGPRYRKLGNRVVYDIEDLVAYAETFPLVEPEAQR